MQAQKGEDELAAPALIPRIKRRPGIRHTAGA
jgi:hypothetical protein